MKLLDQSAILLAEFRAPVVTQRRHLVNSGRAAPASLCKRKIHRDAQNLHIPGKLGGLLVEAPRLRIADRRVERGNRRDHFDLAFELVEPRRLQSFSGKSEARSLLAGLEFWADERHRVTPHRNGAFAFFRHETNLLIFGLIARSRIPNTRL